MEESLLNLLTEWKIPETYIIRLEDQEVYSISTLLLLSDTQIKAIFDKVGTQATFFHNLNQLRNKLDDDSFMTVDQLTHVALHILVEEYFFMDKTTGQTSETSRNGNGTAEAAEQRDERDDSIGNQGNSTDGQETVDVPVDGHETTASQQDQVEKRSQPAQPKATRKRSAASLGNILEMELDTLMNRSLEGKEVIAYYKLKNDLDESHRNKLADVILGHYLKDDHNRKLPTDVKDEMANLILKYFETECKKTWISDTENHRESLIGRGILVKRYYHIRRGLKKSGMLATSSKNKESTNRFNFLGNDEESEEVKEMLSWLNFNKQPWSKLIDYWKQTSEARLRVHINGTQSITAYMDTYIALKDVWLPFEADFEAHFGNSNNLYTQWPMFAAFIEKRAPCDVVEAIKDTFTPEGKKVQTIRALAHLLPVVTVARNKHKTFRPSRQEIEDALLLIVKCVGDIKNELTNRLQKYQPFHLSLSPQAVLVGNDADSIEKSFVRINEVLYEVENPLKALDITFKSMHVLDTKYHEECKREWLFLERAVYKINVDKKGLNSASANLVRDFERFKENSA